MYTMARVNKTSDKISGDLWSENYLRITSAFLELEGKGVRKAKNMPHKTVLKFTLCEGRRGSKYCDKFFRNNLQLLY